MSTTPRAAGVLAVTAGLVLTLAGCDSEPAQNARPEAAPPPSAAPTTPDLGAPNDADVTFAHDMILHHAQAIEIARLATAKATNAQVKNLAGRIVAAQQADIGQLSRWLTEWGHPVLTPASTTPASGAVPSPAGSTAAPLPAQTAAPTAAHLPSTAPVPTALVPPQPTVLQPTVLQPTASRPTASQSVAAAPTDAGMPAIPAGTAPLGDMPGLADTETLQALATAPGVIFDRRYLELMIPHHDGSIQLADGVLDNGGYEPVKDFADQLIRVELAQLDEMRMLLGVG